MEHIKRIIEAHPDATKVDIDLISKTAAEALNCTESCTACADACLAQENVASLARCIRLCQDCADTAQATAQMLLRLSHADQAAMEAQLESCRKACKACEAECAILGEQYEFCAQTAETCRACAEACNFLLTAVPV